MDIQRDKRGGELILILRGRLDASWAGHVADALAAAIRDGEHHLRTEIHQPVVAVVGDVVQGNVDGQGRAPERADSGSVADARSGPVGLRCFCRARP